MLVCYCRFDSFIFIVNLYKYQKDSKSIPANIVGWLEKTILMPNYWASRSVLQWMSVVRNSEIQNGVTQYFQLTVYMFFVLDFFISFMCVWLEKTTVLFICILEQIKSIVFAVFIKFWDESGLAILIRISLRF